MAYLVPEPQFASLPFNRALLTRVRLGARMHFCATEALRHIYRRKSNAAPRPNPGLEILADDLFHSMRHFNHAWSHAIPGGAVAVFADLSVLLFSHVSGDCYRALPTVFRIPRQVPFPANQEGDGNTKFDFDVRGSGKLGLGMNPRRRPDQFLLLGADEETQGKISELARMALPALEMEAHGWIDAHAGVDILPGTAWPVALSAVAPQTTRPQRDIERDLRRWLSSVATYAGELLEMGPNGLSIAIADPEFSQADARIHFSIEVKIADYRNAGKPWALEAVGDHLVTRIGTLLSEEKSPVRPSDALGLFPFHGSQRAGLADLRDAELDVEGFTHINLSQHERLSLEAQTGLRDVIASAQARPLANQQA